MILCHMDGYTTFYLSICHFMDFCGISTFYLFMNILQRSFYVDTSCCFSLVCIGMELLGVTPVGKACSQSGANRPVKLRSVKGKDPLFGGLAPFHSLSGHCSYSPVSCFPHHQCSPSSPPTLCKQLFLWR